MNGEPLAAHSFALTAMTGRFVVIPRSRHPYAAA